MAKPRSTLDTAGLQERFGQSFAAGDVLFREEEEAQRAFWLVDGRVRLLRRIGGAERGLRVAREGELFGEEALLPASQRTAAAIALTDVTVLSFDAASLPELLSTSPQFGAELVQQLLRRSQEAEDRIQISMLRDSQAKVVLGLMRVAQPLANGASAITLDLSPLELSARVGLDVEAVKRTVQQLMEADYVRVSEESLEIPDLDALQELYGLLETSEEIVGGDSR